MTTKPTPPAAKPEPPELDRYMPGDPIPAPQVSETNTESTWALFSDVPPLPDTDFLDTVPASILEEQALNDAPVPPPVPPKPQQGN